MATSTPVDYSVRNSLPARTGYSLALAFIVFGGLIAAVTGPLALAKGSWLSAYLVLVAGVALGLLSRQTRILETPSTPPGREWAVICLWTGGNTPVVLGTLTSTPILTDVGGAVLVAVLILALLATRSARRAVLAWVLRAAYVILIISVPIGLTLTHLRSS